MNQLINLAIAHWFAVVFVLGYILIAVVNQMPEPGTWAQTGGFYGLFYRVTHSLANSSLVQMVELRMMNRAGMSTMVTPTVTTTTTATPAGPETTTVTAPPPPAKV